MFREKEYEINFSYIDNRGIARPSAAFDLMQDIATAHADSLGLDNDSLDVVWVLSRLCVQGTRPLVPHEQVRLRTWCAGTKGPNWLRVFELYVADEKVGEAMSTWVTLNPENHRILRPTQFEQAQVYLKDSMPTALPIPGKLVCEGLKPHHVHTVRYADLDINGHMNNVKIVDMVCDGLDLERREGQFINQVQVNYTSECMPGEAIALYTGVGADGLTYVSGQVDGRVKFEAAAQFAPYELQA